MNWCQGSTYEANFACRANHILTHVKSRLLILATVTLLVFPLIGYGILFLFGKVPSEFLIQSHVPWLWQVPIGMIAGVALGLAAKFVVSRSFLKETETKYARMISRLQLNHTEVVFISFCAGFGEELLFRGGIQPFLGIWPTAILFIALHGYLSPKDWRISVYGLFMTIAIASLGYMTDYLGIWSACIAHMMIDYVLFRHLINFRPVFPLHQNYELD